MGTDESLEVSTMSRPTQGPSSSLEEFPQKIGVPLQEPKNKQPLNHLPQEPPKSWGKSWQAEGFGANTRQMSRDRAVSTQSLEAAFLTLRRRSHTLPSDGTRRPPGRSLTDRRDAHETPGSGCNPSSGSSGSGSGRGERAGG